MITGELTLPPKRTKLHILPDFRKAGNNFDSGKTMKHLLLHGQTAKSIQEAFRSAFEVAGIKTKKVDFLTNFIRFQQKASDSLVDLMDKYLPENIDTKSTASWWSRYILVDWKRGKENGNVDNSLGGAAGVWYEQSELQAVNNEKNTEISGLAHDAINGAFDFIEEMDSYLKIFFDALKEINLIDSNLSYEDRAKIATTNDKRIWQELIGQYAAYPLAHRNGKEPKIMHFKDPALFLPSNGDGEQLRSKADMNSVRVVYYYQKNGEQKKVEFVVEKDKNINSLINLVSEDPESFSDYTSTSSATNPVLELVVFDKSHNRNISMEDTLQLKEVAKSAPFSRIVIDNTSTDALCNMTTLVPHYGANEDTGVGLMRKSMLEMQEDREIAFVPSKVMGEPQIIRTENGKDGLLETVEVVEEFTISEEEKKLIKLTQNFIKKSSSNESKFGLLQLLSLVSSTYTKLPTYGCVSPEKSDLQIALFPLSHNNLIAELSDKVFDGFSFENFRKVVSNNLFTSTPMILGANKNDCKAEFAKYFDFTSDQIADGRKAMALPPLLDTHIPYKLQTLLSVFFPKEHGFIGKSPIQVSSVFHDTEHLGGELNFVTAGSSFAETVLSLTSTKDKKVLNMRNRIGKEELESIRKRLKEASANNTVTEDEVAQEAKNLSHDVLHHQIRRRLFFVCLLIIGTYYDKNINDDFKSNMALIRTINDVTSLLEKEAA